jgi:hypothetical protein
MSNRVLSFTLTTDGWRAAQAAVQQQVGITLTGNEGDVSKDGVEVHYAYNPANLTLTLQVTARKFFDPSVDSIDAQITAAVQRIQAD